jgi:tetratricopeptide (TPR) repeat protein
MKCPSEEELRDLLADRLGTDAEGVESHIEACASCQRALESLTSDTQLNKVRHARAECDDSLESASTWRGESGGDFLRRLENTPPRIGDVLHTPQEGTAGGHSAGGTSTEPQGWPVLEGYQILRELGRGGMGVVYLAWQARPSRPVAIKMILAGAHAGPEQIERFRREAEAVARLQHPNIVQIHEVGEQGGRPFFSLEYVDGTSLPQRLAGTPQPARDAAQFVHTLALAVQYAHQRGVVHRDLKPANVLLVSGGVVSGESSQDTTHHSPLTTYHPKITDFGLAKRLDLDSVQTQTGEVLGTPSYMAPEQAAGKTRLVGPSVDVYALGAILYEMLTGRPPFKAETTFETVRQVATEEPVRPTRLQRKVPRDLETICLRCLQKDPARRYPTALALADDLQRFVSGEPIRARPTPAWEAALKWAKRRPALAGLVTVSILAVVSLAVGGLWYNAHLQSALQDAQVQRDKAREHFAMARDAVDQFHTKVSESAELKAKGTERLRTQLLETALAFYQRFVQEEGGVEVQAERGRAYQRLGLLYRETGHNNEAEAAYEQAASIFQSLVAAHPELQHDLANGYHELARLYLATARTPDADNAMQRALELSKQVADRYPQDQKYRLALASCYRNLCSVYTQTGRLPLGEDAIKSAQTVLESLPADDPEVQELLAHSQHALGTIYHVTNRREAAEKAYARGLELRQALAKTKPDVKPDLVRSYRALGMLYVDSDRFAQAEKSQSEALAICKELAAGHPTVTEYQQLLAGTHELLASVYLETGPPDKAERNYRQALEIQTALVASNPDVLDNVAEQSTTWVNLGMFLGKEGKPKEALESFDRSIAGFESILKREPRHTDAQRGLGFAYSERARIASDLGRDREALANLDRALQMKSDEDKSRLRCRRARLLARLEDHAGAVREASGLAKGGFTDASAFYDLACVYAIASAAARQDARLPMSQRERLAGDYVGQAIAYLRQAKDAGLFKDEKWTGIMKRDKDLDPIRSNAGFLSLLPEARAKSSKK